MLEITNFVAACCCWPHNQDTRKRVQQTAKALKSWNDVKQVVNRHRVAVLVHHAIKDLECVPHSFRDWAKQQALTTAKYAMQRTHECVKIDQAFKAVGIRPVFIKGPVLGQIAFGSVAMKYSYDLDIYVQPEDVFKAAQILHAKGYVVNGRGAAPSGRQIKAVLNHAKDLSFTNSEGSAIELHWKFTYTKRLLLDMEQGPKRQTVTLAGIAELDTLDTTQTIRYLCTHGSLHHWRRLKWLADFAAFLTQLDPQERARAIAEVSNGPSADVLGQALKLCDTLLGTDYGPVLPPNAQKLYDYSLGRIQRPDYRPGLMKGDIDVLRDLLAKRHLFKTLRATFLGLRYILISPQTVLSMPLPRALSFVYVIVRLPSFIFKRIKTRLPFA